MSSGASLPARCRQIWSAAAALHAALTKDSTRQSHFDNQAQLGEAMLEQPRKGACTALESHTEGDQDRHKHS
eukprot:scaffold36868_cov21-Tisochrysis_lutea.AAC.1